jgi:hypothetical protein
MDRWRPLSWRTAIGNLPLISVEVVSIGVETDSGGSLLMGGGRDRFAWDPVRVRHALHHLGRSAGAFSVRTRCSTIRGVFPMTAVTVATFTDRVAAATSHSGLRRPVGSSARMRG